MCDVAVRICAQPYSPHSRPHPHLYPHRHPRMQNGSTALTIGAGCDAKEGTIRLLLQHKADINHTNKVRPWSRVT